MFANLLLIFVRTLRGIPFRAALTGVVAIAGMPLARYFLRRTGYALLVVWAAFTLSWLFLYVLPSDPIELMMQADGASASVSTAEQRSTLERRYGFDKSPVRQYLSMLGQSVQGDLGNSLRLGKPVVQAIAQVLPETLKMTSLALLLSLAAGLTVGSIAAFTRLRWLSNLLTSLPAIGLGVPTFWLGLLALQIFSFHLGWFPALGNRGVESLVLPAAVLAVPGSAMFAQLSFNRLSNTLLQPFVPVLVAKGLNRWTIYYRHVARAAMGAVLTAVGMTVGGLFAGAVVRETVFSRAGVGRLLEEAVSSQDLPLVQGLVMLSAITYALANMLVDLAYPLVDPRVRQQEAA